MQEMSSAVTESPWPALLILASSLLNAENDEDSWLQTTKAE